MAAVDAPHFFPTEQNPVNDAAVDIMMCRPGERNAITRITENNKVEEEGGGGEVPGGPGGGGGGGGDRRDDARDAEAPAGTDNRTPDPPPDALMSPETTAAADDIDVPPRVLPASGDERGEKDDDPCDHMDHFTKPMVQPADALANDMPAVDGEKVDNIKDCTDGQKQDNGASNGLEVDTDGVEGIGNGVDGKTGHKVDAIRKCIRSSLQCKDCGKRFNRRETLNLHRHFHAHNDPTPLTCKECDLTFQDRSSFIKHRKAHKEKAHKEKEQQIIGPNKEAHTSEGRRFTCAHCEKLFSTVEKLRGHNCNKFPDKPYHCPLCRRQFQFKVAIPKHMQTHSLENIFQCQECSQHFSDGVAFRAHQRCHAALKPYECPECGMVFKHYSVMEDHRRKHTESMPSHQCNICGKTFKYSSLLHQHQYLHTGQKPFCCPECGKKFAFAQNMKAHYRQHRLSTTTPLVPPDQPSKQDPVPTHEPANGLGKENTGQTVKPRRLYNCPLCPLKFDIPAKLRAHMLIHEAEYEKLENTPTKETKPMNSEKGYNCPQCPSIFHNKLSYYGHLLKAHRSESRYLEQVSAEHIQLRRRTDGYTKSHKCPQCSKMFHHRSVLESHMRVHSKDKPYQCKVCGKSFRCNSYLRQHLIIHTGERPHKCPECGKEFAFLQNMKTHLKLHQAKPFRCDSCRNCYTDEAQLKQHMLSHKGGKRHKCNLCDKSFSLACSLRDHINTHIGAKPYRCAECHKSFSWLSGLLVHRKSHELRLASSPVTGSATVAPQQPRDTERCQNAFHAPMLSAQIETKVKQAELCVSESCPPPVQWKVDGGEVLPVSLAQKSKQPQVLAQFVSPQHHHSPLKSHSDPSSVPSLEMSNMKESSILISGSLQTAMPKTITPSSEVEKHKQVQPEMWRGMSTSTVVASNSSSSYHFPVSSTYVDGAALWSVKPNPVTSTSQVSPSKQESFTSPKKDDFTPHTAIPTTVGQSGKRQNGGELQKRSPSLAVVSSSAPLDQSKAVLSTNPAPLEACSTLWDMQTHTGIPKTASPSDKLGGNQEFPLQQKKQSGWTNQTSPQKVPVSLPYEPQHFAHGLGPAVWGFQTNHVSPQALLPGHIKPGNAQEVQHQPMVTGTPIILNQASPFFTTSLAPLPLPLALPGPHSLHSVALPRPPYPNLFFTPQAVMRPHMPRTLPLPQPSPRTGPHNLGGRLPVAPEGLLQCMICGHSLPREIDLEMHYLQHAQGEI